MPPNQLSTAIQLSHPVNSAKSIFSWLLLMMSPVCCPTEALPPTLFQQAPLSQECQRLFYRIFPILLFAGDSLKKNKINGAGGVVPVVVERSNLFSTFAEFHESWANYYIFVHVAPVVFLNLVHCLSYLPRIIGAGRSSDNVLTPSPCPIAFPSVSRS